MEILTRFEEFAQNMKNDEISKEILKERYETLPIDSFMQKLQSLTYEFLDSAKTPQNSLTFEEEKTLVKLKSKVKDNSLIVTKADKGNATVINKRADYIDKLQKILSDKSKFELIENPNEDLIQNQEKKLNCILLKLKDEYEDYILEDENGKNIKPVKIKNTFNEKVYNKIRSTGAKCGVCYGLTKVHKDNLPVRPIISNIGTYNYNLAKYLSEVLERNFIEKFKYTLKDSFDFINRLSKRQLEEKDFLISFDTESLFTNVPIDETVEIIKNTFFKLKDSSNLKKVRKNAAIYSSDLYDGDLDGMKWEVFEKLLRCCLQESYFTFNKQIYKQIDGVSMGSPLGPIIANIFMNDFETKHMDKLTELGVKSWDRFVDDTFTIINDKQNAESILNFLNEQHHTIKFTMEKEESNTINFLDIKIKRKNDLTLTTLTYRKPTFTGVMLNWNSLTSIKYKTGLIRCLLDRSDKIFSSEKQKAIEKEQLKTLLLRNNYPIQVIEKEF